MYKSRIQKAIKLAVLALLTLTLAMFATACSGTTQKPFVLSELSKTLNVDQTFTLEVLNLGEKDQVVYDCSDLNVISVGEDGLITALKPGQASVTATVNGAKLGTCVVTVQIPTTPQPVISIENADLVNGEYTLKLAKGDSYTLSPVIKLDGQAQTCAFSLTSNNACVTVDGLVITATDVCENVTVIASCQFNGLTYSVYCFITVMEVA